MAEQYHPGSENPNTKKPSEEVDDRGLFSCFGKKEEKHEQDVTMADHGHKPSLVEKLHRSKSTSSSSSSEEEVEEDGVKIRRKKKKKGLKEKISDKISRKKEGEIENHDAYVVPVEHQDHQIKHNAEPEEKKGILDKLKEKLPGHQKDNEGVPAPPAHVEKPSYADTHNADGEVKEKKGIFEMIKEKLPGGGHKEGEEVEKDH